MIIVVGGTVVDPPPSPPAPPPPPPPPDDQAGPRFNVGVLFTGADGSTWDLHNGPVRLGPGVAGLGPPDPEHRWRESPSLDGSAWQGFRTPKGDPKLPVYIVSQSSLNWLSTDGAFAAALDPAGECALTVTQPDASARTLTMRFAGGADPAYTSDPVMMRYGFYDLEFVSADPFWRGEPVAVVFSAAEPVPLFPGPPFTINPPNAVATAEVTNPGEVECWPRWTFEGPFTSITVGVGASVVTLVAPVLAGQSRIIDMDPRRLTVVDESGADKWLELTEADFAAIPAGSDVPLTLDVSGPDTGTTITLSFTPGYRKAW